MHYAKTILSLTYVQTLLLKILQKDLYVRYLRIITKEKDVVGHFSSQTYSQVHIVL